MNRHLARRDQRQKGPLYSSGLLFSGRALPEWRGIAFLLASYTPAWFKATAGFLLLGKVSATDSIRLVRDQIAGLAGG